LLLRFESQEQRQAQIHGFTARSIIPFPERVSTFPSRVFLDVEALSNPDHLSSLDC